MSSSTTQTDNRRRSSSESRASLVDSPVASLEDVSILPLTEAPWQYKALALACTLLLPIGSHFATTAVGALKSVIKEELKISNTQYGVLQSSVSLINTILPIFGGFFIDAFGTAWGSVVITVVILVGSVLISASTHLQSFALMVVGRVIFGLGSGVIVSMQEAVLSHWFRTKSLAVVIGVQLSVSRLASFLGTLVVVPLVQATGFYGWAFWLASLICLISVLVNIAYTLLLVRLNRHITTTEEMQILKRKKTFRWRDILFFPSNFWLLILLNFFLGGIWSSFLTINTELIQIRFGTSYLNAAYYSSVSQVVPIVVNPFLGLFFDRVGKRMTILTISAILLLACMALIGFTYIHPMVSMLIFSFSLALGPLPMLSSIPIVNPIAYVGTGLGIYKSVSSIGSTILNILVGVIQDVTPGQNYDIVMPVLTALSVVTALIAAAVWAVDRWKYKGILEMNTERRKPIMQLKEMKEQQDREGMVEGVWSRWNYLYGGMYLVSFIAVWVLYFAFVLSSSTLSSSTLIV